MTAIATLEYQPRLVQIVVSVLMSLAIIGFGVALWQSGILALIEWLFLFSKTGLATLGYGIFVGSISPLLFR